MKKAFLFAIVALLVLAACKKEAEQKPREAVQKGVAKSFQHGQAWTWYEVDAAGNPKRLAIAIDDAAMSSLEAPGTAPGGHHHENSLSLALPANAGNIPFKHALLDWNPNGHDPVGVYDKAHFDFHFYTTTEADRKAIPAYTQATEKFNNLPGADHMPTAYIATPEGVPQMGKHWVDVTSSEFTPAGFNQTFMYGSYDGKVTFYEPMITEAFIKANPTFERSIPLPAKFQQSGWYPTKMRIAKANGATSIILENFVQRQAN